MRGGELLDPIDNYHVPENGLCGESNLDNERDTRK
jgi:hypothetical protein